jgi:mRNA-degrading endonuclease toxin of MazEF toxin-antitoxin module
VPTLSQGRMVAAEVLDPQGRNPKIRPVVIVTPTEAIQPGVAFYGVAITGSLPNPLTAEFVLISFQVDGRGRTGMKKRCAAKCDWLVPPQHDLARHDIGFVSTKVLTAIVERVASLE